MDDRKKEKPLPKPWNYYRINPIVNLSISIWAERCIMSRAKFRDSDHELVLHNCLTLLQEIAGDPTQILTTDWDSLIVKKIKLEEYKLGTLEN